MDYFTKYVWHIIRIVTLYVVGLLNTFFISPEAAGSFMNYFGYILLLARPL